MRLLRANTSHFSEEKAATTCSEELTDRKETNVILVLGGGFKFFNSFRKPPFLLKYLVKT